MFYFLIDYSFFRRLLFKIMLSGLLRKVSIDVQYSDDSKIADLSCRDGNCPQTIIKNAKRHSITTYQKYQLIRAIITHNNSILLHQ